MWLLPLVNKFGNVALRALHTHYNHDRIAAVDNGIQYIRDIVGNQFSEDDMIKAIKHSSMDAATALNYLIEKGMYLSDVSVYLHS